METTSSQSVHQYAALRRYFEAVVFSAPRKVIRLNNVAFTLLLEMSQVGYTDDVCAHWQRCLQGVGLHSQYYPDDPELVLVWSSAHYRNFNQAHHAYEAAVDS